MPRVEPYYDSGFLEIGNEPRPLWRSRFVRFALIALLIAVMVQQCGAWVRPAYEFIDISAHVFDDPLFGIFQKLIFLLEGILILGVIQSKGLTQLVRVLIPLWPFFLCGVISTLWSFDVPGSARILFYWLMMSLTAASLSLVLEASDLAKGLLLGLSLILGGSVLLVVLLPANGTMMYVGGPVWRGLMSSKNDYGWVAVLGLCVAAFPPSAGDGAKHLGLRSLLAVVAMASLVGSQSKTALITACVAIFIWLTMTVLRRRWSIGLVLLSTFIVISTVVVLAVVNLPAIEAFLRSIGRDLTFTGRDDVWSLYVPEIMKAPWLGQGPGAYTLASKFTEPLAHRLMEDGLIFTPHNMYLATIGDGGVIALCAKLGALVFFIERALRHDITTPLGAMTVALLIGGISETREVFANGPTMYLSLIAWGAMLASRPSSH